MLNEIISKFEHFSDALILEFHYRTVDGLKEIDLLIDCMNAANDYKFEVIRLTFSDVQYFRFHQSDNRSSTLINSALLAWENDVITFDFFPNIYGGGILKENAESDFKIKCRHVRYSDL